MQTFDATVLSRRETAETFVELTLLAPALFEAPVEPGMFVHIRVPDAPQHLLRRPVSIMDADRREKTLLLGIGPKGGGTRAICAVSPGGALGLLGPLGKGFDAADAQSIWLVGGGVGAAPLLFAARRYSAAARVAAFLGFGRRAQAISPERFERWADRVLLCTDDGSAGFCGTVCEALAAEGGRPDLILACGPVGMLRAVQDFALNRKISCQLSLEERMGCGVGACLTCPCRVRRADGSQTYARVCADGPVFDAREVIL